LLSDIWRAFLGFGRKKRNKYKIKKTTIFGGFFDGECPYADLFRTGNKRIGDVNL